MTELRQLSPHHATSTAIHTDRGTFAALVTAGPDDLPTALLVPGYTGAKEDFAAIIDPLAAAGFRIVALDMRGQYESDGPDDPDAYTPDELGADIIAVAAAICPQPVHLLGHSFGGLATRAAVIADPHRFADYTIMASGPAALPDGRRKTIVEASFPLLGNLPMGEIYDLGQQINEQDPNFVATAEPLATYYRDRFIATTPASLVGMGRAMLGEPDRVAELAATGVPIMVLYSEQDDAWPAASQAEMASRLGGQVALIPDAGHSPAVENPEATVDALVSFWRSHP